MSVDLSNCSLTQWFAEREQHRCGYCKNPSGSISYGMMTEQLTVEDYKDLIDRGWRRSGKYCYKPTLDKTCCPQYTIRCDAIDFTLNKSHKKIIKKFNKFLSDGLFNKNVPPDQQEEETSNEIPGYNKKSTINLSKSIIRGEGSSCGINLNVEDVDNLDCDIEPNVEMDEPDGHEVCLSNEKNVDNNLQSQKVSAVQSPESFKKIKKPLKDCTGPDPNKPPCKKAKLLRLERKKEKLKLKGEEMESSNKKNNNVQKTLSQFFEERLSTAKHKFKTVLVRMHNKHENFGTSAKLYKKYQLTVHDDCPEQCGENEFNDFLVRTPLQPKPFPDGIEGPGYGSFHQQYWLDEKLIAVGVIDILPGCVSSVYFFYDPDYRDLTLGTYGSLREIQLVQSLNPKVPDLRYYYMGFYIHSCPKMRYKGKLHPSDLLCPETYVWRPIKQCLPKLEVNKYSRFNEDIDAVDANSCSEFDIDSIKIVYDYKLMSVKDYVRVFDGDREVFENMANLIGRKSAYSIIFWI